MIRLFRRLRCIVTGLHMNGPGVSCHWCYTRNMGALLAERRSESFRDELLRPFDIAPRWEWERKKAAIDWGREWREYGPPS